MQTAKADYSVTFMQQGSAGATKTLPHPDHIHVLASRRQMQQRVAVAIGCVCTGAGGQLVRNHCIVCLNMLRSQFDKHAPTGAPCAVHVIWCFIRTVIEGTVSHDPAGAPLDCPHAAALSSARCASRLPATCALAPERSVVVSPNTSCRSC